MGDNFSLPKVQKLPSSSKILHLFCYIFGEKTFKIIVFCFYLLLTVRQLFWNWVCILKTAPLSPQMLLLHDQDCGCDVDSVENLIRRHEEIEREAGVIQERAMVRHGGLRLSAPPLSYVGGELWLKNVSVFRLFCSKWSKKNLIAGNLKSWPHNNTQNKIITKAKWDALHFDRWKVANNLCVQDTF